jgi:peptide/nickel transport system ATP-binding protein
MMVTNSVGTQFIASDNERPDVPLLEVKSLSVDYQAANGTVHAVTDVSFTLQRGQVLGLAGESGSGKSTLAYAIARLLRPPANVTQGEIWYYPRQGDAVSRRNVSGEDVELKPLKGQEGMGEDNEKVDILELSSAQLRAFRWRELSIVFQSAMNALNPVATIESQVRDVLKAHSPTMTKDMCKLRAIELLRLVGIAPDRLRSYPRQAPLS